MSDKEIEYDYKIVSNELVVYADGKIKCQIDLIRHQEYLIALLKAKDDCILKMSKISKEMCNKLTEKAKNLARLAGEIADV